MEVAKESYPTQLIDDMEELSRVVDGQNRSDRAWICRVSERSRFLVTVFRYKEAKYDEDGKELCQARYRIGIKLPKRRFNISGVRTLTAMGSFDALGIASTDTSYTRNVPEEMITKDNIYLWVSALIYMSQKCKNLKSKFDNFVDIMGVYVEENMRNICPINKNI